MENVISPEVTITLKGNDYNLRFPNIGQTIQIEVSKQELTNGRYALMAWGSLQTSESALDMVDAISYFSELLGSRLYKLYNVKTKKELVGLEPSIIEDMVKEYTEKYVPFYNSIAEPSKRAKTVQTPRDIEHKDETPNTESENDE